MRKPAIILMLFMISGNIFVFIYGICIYSQACAQREKQQDNYALDSALTLAVHAYEDDPYKMNFEQEFTLAARDAGYIARRLDTGEIYIKVYIKRGDEIIYREYLKEKNMPVEYVPVKRVVNNNPPVPSPITATATAPAAKPSAPAAKSTPVFVPLK